MNTASYRIQLKEAFERRKRNNPSYSLRAFAKSLGLASSSLTEILQGKINLSPERAQKIVEKLGWSGAEKEHFLLRVQMESSSSIELKQVLLDLIRAKSGSENVHDLSVDLFVAVSDWFHFAILEYTYIDPSLSKKAVSKAFNIPEVSVELAIDRLIRLELLEHKEDGAYAKAKGRVLAQAKIPNEAIFKALDQFAERASQVLRTQPVQERFNGIEYLPFSPEDVSKAKVLTENYISEMLALSKASTSRDRVYGLGVQFFNVQDTVIKKESV